ncbi:glyoxylase-like metal-dependent hydrolase (beta-lactamase superfamily II) [Kribbella voronezhensis]|uniref:Glyoxylase-like metal-dependent hydrolase (Beta-lactamase superfamily II) n=1 Tax=Kribbella voronezhensis TaxID=2512212 RepID=A0A4R7T9H8_9ACTN|nr:MBL fold metallo-hydrolase [Kribbella voronezhensis]TDU88016.1 glyoxylase-like metal-dependent hydrolase (beta-lactamase superfamily II) [Kribbella voronezhensis]
MVDVAPREQLRIGRTTVTYLPDGEVRLSPSELFPASAPAGWTRYGTYLDADGRLPVSVGSFLVRTPSSAVLVDLGLGEVDFELPGVASFRGGRLLTSLADEGLSPDDIDAVLFTHLHHDHVGWTSNLAPAPSMAGHRVEGLTFAKARHFVDRREWEHWAGVDELVGPHPEAVQRPLAEVAQFFSDPGFDLPGLEILPTAGHTPGHVSIVVADPDSEQRLVILGDVMHTQAQVSEPTWNFRFDVDPDRSLRTRQEFLTRFAGSPDLIAGGHFANSVFGHIEALTTTHQWATMPQPAPVD